MPLRVMVAAASTRLAQLEDELAAVAAAQAVPGPPGPSAYELAKAAGFVGTQAAWLASLAGAPADMSRVVALEQRACAARVTIGGTLAGNASKSVTLALPLDLGASYSYGLAVEALGAGGAAVLAKVGIEGVTARTGTSLTVLVKNRDTLTSVDLSTAALVVVAFKAA